MKRGTNLAILFLAVFFTTSISSFAQQYPDIDSLIENFSELRSYGEPPAEFTNSASYKYKQDAANSVDATDNRKIQKMKDQFYLVYNFEQDRLMSSGTVLYNDHVTQYVRKVADNVLKNDPELRKNLHFYVTKGAAVNAFAYNNGVIMVNIGLIAQLVTEAQLAFVLSHEATHVTKKHSIDRYLDREDLLKGKNDYEGLTFNKRILAYNRNSREHEEEADKKGFDEIYISSNYSLGSILGVFDVLQYSYLPFDLEKFDFSLLESKYSKIPEGKLLDEVNQIGEVIDEADMEENEEWSSHPNVNKRREYVNELVEDNKGSHNGEEFIQSEELFKKIRTLARFEVIRQDIIYGDYPKALYNTYIELKERPNNKFLEKAFASCLYGLSRYKTGRHSRDVIYNYKKIEGESQQLYYLFKRLSKKEACIVALRHCWKLKQKYPNSEYYSMITEDLFEDLIGKHKLKIKDFSQERPLTDEEQAIQDSIELSEIDSADLSKYQKIKRKKKKDEEKDFIKYGFVELFQADSSFYEYYMDMQKKVREDRDYNDSDDDIDAQMDDLLGSYGQNASNEGMQLGIHKLLIFQPSYSILDNRFRAIVKNGGSSKYLESEERGNRYKEFIRKNADMIGLDVTIVDSKEIKEGDKEGFANMMSLRDVINEQLNSTVDITKFTHEDAVRLAEYYGTKYVALTGVISARQPKNGIVMAIYTILGVVPGIAYAVNPNYDMIMYMIVFDIETGESKLIFVDRNGTKDREDILNSKLYYLFYNIQRERMIK